MVPPLCSGTINSNTAIGTSKLVHVYTCRSMFQRCRGHSLLAEDGSVCVYLGWNGACVQTEMKYLKVRVSNFFKCGKFIY
jgi:hypothetical protein